MDDSLCEKLIVPTMRKLKKVESTDEARARARLLAHFEDNPESVFYSRQLEVIYENEYFHWVTNRAIRRLIEEGRVTSETRILALGSEVKLLWNSKYRFYKRAATEVFNLVNEYSGSAGDGSLGLQGEHMVLAAFAREKFLLLAEEAAEHNGLKWTETGHDLDYIFEKNSISYGVEVKNTLGYLDIDEFVAKVRMCLRLGIKPIFAVRALPRTWADALIAAGGYAMIMRFQFYPWTHEGLATRIRERLMLPVDTPRRIEAGTMARLDHWIANPIVQSPTSAKVDRVLAQFEEGRRKAREARKSV